MKLTEKLKESTQKGKELVEKHRTKLMLVGGILLVGVSTCGICKVRRDLKLHDAEFDAQYKKAFEKFAKDPTVIEGTGPIWDKLRELFSSIDMEPHEIWMVEANEVGKKLIARIPGGDVMEQLEI